MLSFRGGGTGGQGGAIAPPTFQITPKSALLHALGCPFEFLDAYIHTYIHSFLMINVVLI